MSAKTVLILLQESRPDALPWPDDLGGDTVKQIMDWVCETFEDLSTRVLATGAYDEIVSLVDTDCTATKLAAALIDHTIRGDTIDLVVIGHGGDKHLVLHDGVWFTTADVRALLVQANQNNLRHLNLRMVYMCNCYGSTLNEAWCDVGARVSIGPKRNNYMPEPETTDFLLLWTQKGECASQAAAHAYDACKAAYWSILVPDPLLGLPLPVGILYEGKGWFDDSTLIVTGDANVSKGWMFAGTPFGVDPSVFPKEVRCEPPFLKEVSISQPLQAATPNGYGSFAGVPSNERYRAAWAGGLSGSQRDRIIFHDGLLNPALESYVFLRFGPTDESGKYRAMQGGTLTLSVSGDGSSWSVLGALHAASDQNGAYYWVRGMLPNPGSARIAYTLKVEGRDAVHHAANRQPRGDELDSDPRSAAFVDFNHPPTFPFGAYSPGPDSTHVVRVTQPPRLDAYEPNDSFATATVIDLQATHLATRDAMSLFPASDADYFLVLLPDAPDIPSWPGGMAVPVGGNRWLSIRSWPASVRIETLIEDIGDGTPRPDVHVFNAGKQDKAQGHSVLVLPRPRALLGGRSLFVCVKASPSQPANYAMRFEFQPAGWCMSVHPIVLVDIASRFIRDRRDPVIRDMLTGRGERIDNPADALSRFAHALDYRAIDRVTDKQGLQTTAGFLVGLAQVLAKAERAEASHVLETAQQVARKAGHPRLAEGALHGLETVLLAGNDLRGMAGMRRRFGSPDG